MNIKTSYDLLFVKQMNRLSNKYPTLMDIEGLGPDSFDIMKFSNKFYKSSNNADASIDDNANIGQYKTSHSFANSAFKPHTKLHSYYLMWEKLSKVYSITDANDVLEHVISGDVYIHDATNMTIPYCFNYTCYDIAINGLPAWSGIAEITAPTTMTSFSNQVKNFLISAASQQMGATGIADYVPFLSWYVQKALLGYGKGVLVAENFKNKKTFEDAVYTEVENVIKSFIHDLNFKYKGDQSLFTNVSIYDDHFLDTMLKDITMPGPCPKIDKAVVKKVQEIYCKVYNNILNKSIITYPVTTACVSVYNEASYVINGTLNYDHNSVIIKRTAGFMAKSSEVKANELKVGDTIVVDNENVTIETLDENITAPNVVRDMDFLKMIAKYNISKQWCNVYNGETSVLSSCCRLRSNVDEFENYNSVTGSGSAKIGSLGVATINMPRIAYKFNNGGISQVEEELAKLTEVTIKINYVKRLMIQESIDRNMLPIYTDGYMDINRQFATTGIIGVYEFTEALGWDITKQKDLDKLVDILNHITNTQTYLRDNVKIKGNETGYKAMKFNMEQVPGESVSVKLCQKDIALGYNVKADIYSNQFIPLSSNVNLLTRIRVSGKLDSQMSGGSILHIGLDSPITDVDTYVDLMVNIAASGIKTWAINYTLGKCAECKQTSVFSKGNYFCPHCGSPNVELYERIVGYLVAINAFSSHKRNFDFNERHYYTV